MKLGKCDLFFLLSVIIVIYHVKDFCAEIWSKLIFDQDDINVVTVLQELCPQVMYNNITINRNLSRQP